MKKQCILLISLIMLLGISIAAYAAEVPNSFDFEDYTGGMPTGWSGGGTSYLKPKILDEEHGTSVEISNDGPSNKAELQYLIPTVSEGRFLISFEINAKDTNKNLRITMNSPSTNTLWHSLFYLNNAGEICAWMNTSNGGWEPQKMVSYAVDTWYKIDILIDMDNKKIEYYVDGVYYTTSMVAFNDFNGFYFRTENGAEDKWGYTYLDNVTFRYVTAESMQVSLKNDVISAGMDTVQLGFSDVVALGTLNKIEAYCMGSNPIEFTETSVNCEVVSKDSSKMTVKFDEPLKENMVYKIEIPGLTSLYGDEYKNNSVYFATNRAMTFKRVINADFSTASIGSSINPASDTEWEKTGGVYVRVVAANDLNEDGVDVNVVRFSQRDSDLAIKRTFTSAYEESIVLEYKMKSEFPMQSFKVYDTEGEVVDFVTVKADGIYFGENKLADYTAAWFTVSIELNQSDMTAKFLIDGEEKGEYSYAGIANVKAVEFMQTNADGATGDKRAKTDIAYFSLSASLPGVGVEMVMFEDADGNVYYPDDKITSKLSKIMIKFSNSVKSSTLNSSNVKLLTDGTAESFAGSYDAISKIYTIELPQYLWGGSTYTLQITDDVLDSESSAIVPASGDFVTEIGLFEANDLGVEILGGSVTVNTSITHTDKSYEDVYLIYAAYNGDFMVDFAATKIVPADGERKLSKQQTYIPPAEADSIRAFLWDGFATRKPVLPVKAILNE